MTTVAPKSSAQSSRSWLIQMLTVAAVLLGVLVARGGSAQTPAIPVRPAAPAPAANSLKIVTPAVAAAPAGASHAPAELLHDAEEPEGEAVVASAHIAGTSATAGSISSASHSSIASPHRRIIWMQVTAYCACKKCCGPRAIGITASGRSVRYNGGRFVAADTSILPFGATIIVPGYANGQPVQVIDRGGAIRGYHIDVFLPTHEEAQDWGKKWLPVTVVE